MIVKVYNRKADHDPTQLLESLTKETDLVRVQASDYHEPREEDLDFESRILCGAETIMSDIKKVLGIVDLEIFMKHHMYDHAFERGDLVEVDGKLFLKSEVGYIPAEIKN